jgi:hypothetical protein
MIGAWPLPSSRRPQRRLEDPIQTGIVRVLRLGLPPDWIVHHSPNGLKRTLAAGSRAKMLGTVAGFPDLIILGSVENRPFAGFIEVKVVGRSKPSDVQIALIKRLVRHGFRVGVVTSIDEAVQLCRTWGLPLRVSSKEINYEE